MKVIEVTTRKVLRPLRPTRDGSKFNAFVELRALNYPGSTYTLTYAPQQDQLKGIYFQAVQQQRFDVEFVRMK